MFAERLILLRECSGLSRLQLAKRIGTLESTLRSYETGKTLPKTDMLIKLSEYFGVSADYLLGIVDTPAQYTKLREGLFKERLKQLRYFYEMTQKELSLKSGVPERSISWYERGGSSPLSRNVVSIAEVFGVSVDYLIGISDSPQRK